MKEISKLLTLLLALAMVLTLIPAVARAEEAMPEGGSGSAEIPVRVNPLYEGIYEPALEDMPQIPEPDEYSTQAVSYQTVEQAAATVRTNMKNRVETYNVYVRSTSSDYDALYFELLNGAVMHTGVGNEGDYLMWHLATYGGEVSWIVSDGYYNYTYTFAMTYYTTAEQEAETTTAVNNLISSLGVKNKSDYEKVCAVYDWMCANITYDYDHVNDSSYKLMFSAYAALVNKTAVCQGYAQLFYRLMLELGVDTRFIGGDGGGPHAWNIVQLGDYYYNVDSTWDAGQEEYSWFLTSFWDFPGHQRDLAYDTFEFHEAYPVAAESYEPGKTATKGMDITGGYCGTEDNGYANAMWILSRDGSLTIVGTGSTLDYNSSNQRPYFLYWESGITKVVVDEGITRIGNYAFYQLPNLTEVLTSESLEEIGQYAFYRCPKLAKVTFSEGLKTISQYAFRDCTSITALNLPDSLTTIGKGAFYGLTGITSLKLPSGLTEIGENAFYQCSALKEVVFPDNITVVGKGMFYYCTALEKVHLPANLVTIESGAFSNCTALKNVEFPDSLKTIGGTAFNFCTSLESIDLPEKLETIGTGAFLACRKVKSITFPANVTLGMNVLDQCTSLETVILPEGLTEIPQEMFARCSALKTVVIPESVTVIHGYAFNECTALESIDLPDHLTTIGRYAFTKCSSLSSIEIPKTVTVLEEGAFNACTSLKSANLPTNLQTIKDYTFYLCPLESVIIPAGVKSIGLNAFRGAMITELVIPEGVTTIDQNAFAACTELTKVDLPDSLKYLSGFGWCTKLTSVSIPDNVLRIGISAFAGCTGLESIRMPNTVTQVNAYAFDGCTGLKTVQMSMNVTDIGMDAFADCTALETITIPALIEWLEYRAFAGCTQLKEIKFLGDAPNFQYDTFSGVTATAYYPEGNETWTVEKRRNYGGSLTWEPYGKDSGDHDYIAVITEPTCTQRGYTTYTCSKCGEIFVTDYVDALGHDMGQWYATTEPGCKTGGNGRRDCTRCNYHESKGLDPMGHEFMDGACIRCDEAAAEGADYSLYYSDYEWEVLRLVNRERVKNGLNPLSGSVLLQQASDIRAQELDELLSYTRPNGNSWYSVLEELDVYIKTASEMIAASQEAQYTPAQVVEYWLNSEDHNYKLLSTDITHTGVGYYEGNSLNWEQCMCSYHWGSNSDLSIHLSKGYTFPMGTSVDDMGIYAVLENSIYGKCFLPIMEEFVTDYDPSLGGTQNITVRTLGFTRTVTVILNDCSHVYETAITAPTCTEQGYTTYTCSECGHSYVDDYTDPVDHSYEDGHCKWCGKGQAYAKIVSYSTSLGGNIAMNFYVELSEDLVADPDAYIQFSFAGKTVNLPLSEGVLSGTSYRFACPITSKNMTDDITAQVYNANGPVGDAKTMAVDTYCNWIIANTSDQKTINLMKAMLNYGASAQMLFNYRTDDLANAALADADKVFGKVDASAFAHSRVGEEDGIKPVSYTLLLDSETTVRCYFELTGDKSIDEFTFTVDGIKVEPVYKDGYYYIEKANIAAHRLDDMHTFTCGNITITYGGLSYVNQVMTYYTSGTTFDMASALYAYSKAAEAYIG